LKRRELRGFLRVAGAPRQRIPSIAQASPFFPNIADKGLRSRAPKKPVENKNGGKMPPVRNKTHNYLEKSLAHIMDLSSQILQIGMPLMPNERSIWAGQQV
jgi:hypothetical protein